MKILPRFLLLLLALPPLCAQPGDGDRHGDHRRDEQPRVILYSGDNYTGVAIELAPRDELSELAEVRFSDGRKAHDRISSVRIFGGLRVTLFADPGYFGEKLELTDSVPRLGRIPRPRSHNWDNCLSSVRVGPGSGRWHATERRPEPERGYDRPPRSEPRDDDRRPPQREPEHRPSFDTERETIRAFRDLLQREPTGRELRDYRERLVAEGWSREQLRDAIRSGREYRSREADRIIVRVYRELLGREPDQSGWAHWRAKIVDHGWSEQRLRKTIREGDEFRQRQNQPKPAKQH
ncbi:MAG: hypothetical protein IPL39_01550 [Opitutaceae bacterium]|nr:hypothetical protein [Opitutaceae bacterium]